MYQSKSPSDEVLEHMSMFPGTTAVVETNKRSILRCPSLEVAKDLAFNLTRTGWNCELRAGLKTACYYIQVNLSSYC